MKIKCAICRLIMGSKMEYDKHMREVHKTHPLRKEKLQELMLIE